MNVRSRLVDLLSHQKYDQALDFLSRTESERDLTTAELVAKGRCLQLASDLAGGSLADARDAFLKALEVDPEYVPALIELAFFYYAVEDDAEKALPLFDRAIEISRAQMTDAVVGKSDCLEELQSKAVAAAFVRDLVHQPLLVEKLAEAKKAWLKRATGG